MSTLTVTTLKMPGTPLGPENPLPSLGGSSDLHTVDPPDCLPQDMQRNMRLGHVKNILPYTTQDGYTRQLEPMEHKAIVLENEILRATFLPQLGGRLWSLYHKQAQRELLYINPVLRPVNFAIRNAWFSGGVEWNIGTIGHCPFTCSPLFAAQVNLPDGPPALRMWEWERIRNIPFQIDAWLPENSPVLYVRMRIINPHENEIPIYWWSNAALPETPKTRTIVPAEKAFSFGYTSAGLGSAPIPYREEQDLSYSLNIPHSADFFYDIPNQHPPWIAGIDEQGRGMFIASTRRLRGRKMFVWGAGQGGQRWQKFLTENGEPYIELQAGLARTQMEHLPMPAKTNWTWLEAYGLAQTDPSRVHGNDWSTAVAAVQQSIDQQAAITDLEHREQQATQWLDTPPEKIIQTASGWGALEQQRRQIKSIPSATPAGIQFPQSSLTDAQHYWLHLLQHNQPMPAPNDNAPTNFLIQPEWRKLLEQTLQNTATADWLAWWHLGLMRFHAQQHDAARTAWEQANTLHQTAWTWRNLAMLADLQNRENDAADAIQQAIKLQPHTIPLLLECADILIKTQHPKKWLTIYDALPQQLHQHSRLQLQTARAAIAAHQFDRVQPLFQPGFEIDDLREGENSLNELWYSYHEQRLIKEENIPHNENLRQRVRKELPPPKHFDFSMGHYQDQ